LLIRSPALLPDLLIPFHDDRSVNFGAGTTVLLVDAEVHEIGRAPPLTGYVAEALFNTVATDDCIFGFQATSNESMLRRELYSAGAMLVSYDYTNGTEREVRFWPRRVATHLRSQLEEEAHQLKTKGWSVLRFVPGDETRNIRGKTTE
jgi:hypothetical protein